MKPHYFGDADAPLYGIYDEPRTESGERLAVLACYPIAGEYMRAHRAFRQLAGLLSRAGAHVMRFDYTGTGDSAGDVDEASVEAWTEDVGRAVTELRELCDPPAVKVVGLRLGATLGLLAAERIDAVDQVVLWDPIVDGGTYVRELEGRHLAEQRERRAPAVTNGTIGVNGFPVSRRVREEVAGIDLLRSEPKRPLQVDLVVSSERPAWDALRGRLEEVRPGSRYALSPSAGDWDEVDAFGSALIPQSIIQTIVGFVTEKGR